MTDKREPKYFCDHCYIKKFNPLTKKGEYKSFECYNFAKWDKHINSEKHIKNTKNIDKCTDERYWCGLCETQFNEISYNLHYERNKDFIPNYTKYEQAECNMFLHRNHLYSSFKAMAKGRIKHQTKLNDKRLKKLQNVKLKIRKSDKSIPYRVINHSEDDKQEIEEQIEEREYRSPSPFSDEPIGYCNEFDCGLPVYDNLTPGKIECLEANGMLFCMCEEYNSS